MKTHTLVSLLLVLNLWCSIVQAQNTKATAPSKPTIKNPNTDWKGFMYQIRNNQADVDDITLSELALLNLALKNRSKDDISTLKNKGAIDPCMMINGKSRLYLEVTKTYPDLSAIKLLAPYYNKQTLTSYSLTAIDGDQGSVASILAFNSDHTKVLTYAAKKSKSTLFNELIKEGIKSKDPEILFTAIESRNTAIVRSSIDKLKIPSFEGFKRSLADHYDDISKTIIQTNNFDKTKGAIYIIQTEGFQFLELLVSSTNANTLLDEAINYHNEKAIEIIVRKGGNPDVAIPYSIENRKISLLKFLMVEGRANPDYALSFAWDNRHLNSIKTDLKIILDAGANPRGYVLKAAQIGDRLLTETFINYGGDPDEAFFEMIARKDYHFLSFLLSRGADATDPSYMKKAGSQGDRRLAILLHDHGGHYNDAAYSAVHSSQHDMVEWLLTKSVDFSSSKYLCSAINKADISMIKILINKGKSNPQNGVECALSTCKQELIDILLKAGANLNHNSYLEIASKSGCSTYLIDQIIARGIDPQIGMMPGVSNGQFQIVKHLISKGANATSSSLLEVAAQRNDLDIAELLMTNGSDPNAGDAISIAVNNGLDEILTSFIEYKADVTDPNLMATAVQRLDGKIIRILGNNGADCKPIAYLRHSLEKENYSVTEILLSLGADPSPREHLDKTILVHNNLSVTQLLIKFGADASPGEYIHHAVEKGHREMAEFLLNHSDLCYTDHVNRGLLHIAVSNRDIPMTSMLVEAGLPTNKRDIANQIPLQLAVSQIATEANWKEINMNLAEILVLKGNANPKEKVRNKKGKMEYVWQVAKPSKVKSFLKKQARTHRKINRLPFLCQQDSTNF